MSKNLLHSNIIEINDSSLLQILMLGNIFDSPKKTHLSSLIQQIEEGNKKLYKQFTTIIIDLIRKNPTKKQLKQLMYDHITQLTISANPPLIHDLNNDVFTLFSSLYKQNQGLQSYPSLWKHMYNGKKDREDFPNVAKTLQKIATPESVQIRGKLANYYSQFIKNVEKAKQKKVQFFEDFEDSSLSQSLIDQSRITEIVYMDIMELKAIRQRVQKQQLSEQNCTEYLIKMKTFLNLRPNSLSSELSAQFNKQKAWAKHFIDNHHEYLKRSQNISRKSGNLTNPLLISLSKDEESINQPPIKFNRNNQKPTLQTSPKQHTFGYLDTGSNKKYIESQVNKFTINQVPIDESRFTEKASENPIPAFNNSINQELLLPNHKSFNQDNFEKLKNHQNNFYQKMSFQPASHLNNAVKPIPISRPSPEQTLPLQESTLHNMSIPVQKGIFAMKTNQLQHFPKNPNHQNKVIDYPSQSKQSFSASHNTFVNSRTNYNPQSKTPYDYYKSQHKDIAQSPIRNRMTQDDLDSNFDGPLVIKPHYQTIVQNYQKSPNMLGYAQTQYNFHTYNQQSRNLNFTSNQKIRSQQLSPRSYGFTEQRSQKKRLSQLTSQKKERKKKALNQENLSYPEEYAYRPYSVHFKFKSENFNNFKRNCLEENFPVYLSSQLVVSCALRKLKDSKLQVEVRYENQTLKQMIINVMYKIPKSFKIEKVSRIHKKFSLKNCQTHVFNLVVLEFPLEMCLIDLGCKLEDEQVISGLSIHLPITIRNFIETLATSRTEWMKTFNKLTSQNQNQPYLLEKTFELNRQIVDPSELERVLSKEFIKIGASQGYSVEQFGCICFYRDINNLIFLVRISIRVDHIVTVSIMTDDQTTPNQKDFMKYYLELLVTLLAKYPI